MREFYREREPQMTLLPVHLNDLARQVVDLTRARWSDIPQQRGIVIQLNLELEADLPTIMGVESEIREALINLMFNAIDAMPDGGTMSLRTRTSAEQDPKPRRVYFEVIDTGVGMDEDTQRRCLEPFFTSKGERGTGLGLATVYGMSERHSAEIEFESSPGEGTTIRLGFTAPDGSSDGLIAHETVQVGFSPLNILIIDDDPLVLNSLNDVLMADGHKVVAANGGTAGIESFRAAIAQNEPFDAVITDLGMPYVDGRQVAGAIKVLSRTTPVILLTGWGQRLLTNDGIPA